MSDELPFPPHLKQAQRALATAGIPIEALPHALTALQLAAKFYHTTTHVSRTDQLRRDRDQAQQELERISADLLATRKSNRELLTKVSSFPGALAAARQDAQREADQNTGIYMSIVARLRDALHELAAIVNKAEAEPKPTLIFTKRKLADILAGSPTRKHRLLAAQLLQVPPKP